MSQQINLKEIAKVKLKADLYKELYESMRDELKAKMEEAKIKEISDPDGVLKINLVPSIKKEFSIQKVRAVLGDKAVVCIKESVDAKAFMSTVKNLELNEKVYKTCYSEDTSHSITWDGLDVYKSELEKKITNSEKKNA